VKLVPTTGVLSDNDSCYRSHLWRDTCAELNITPRKTRAYRPQTNGKIERFHRTMADGWAFKKFYSTESARRRALPAWLHEYNHHRPHTAIGRSTPITRLSNRFRDRTVVLSRLLMITSVRPPRIRLRDGLDPEHRAQGGLRLTVIRGGTTHLRRGTVSAVSALPGTGPTITRASARLLRERPRCHPRRA
jgi:hypothetical protein